MIATTRPSATPEGRNSLNVPMTACLKPSRFHKANSTQPANAKAEEHDQLREGAEEEAERQRSRGAALGLAGEPAVDQQDRGEQRQRHRGIAARLRAEGDEHGGDREQQRSDQAERVAAARADCGGEEDRGGAGDDRQCAGEQGRCVEPDEQQPERVQVVVVVVIDVEEHAERSARVMRLLRRPGLVEPERALRTGDAQREAERTSAPSNHQNRLSPPAIPCIALSCVSGKARTSQRA
jgi:hypothetical protein